MPLPGICVAPGLPAFCAFMLLLPLACSSDTSFQDTHLARIYLPSYTRPSQPKKCRKPVFPCAVAKWQASAGKWTHGSCQYRAKDLTHMALQHQWLFSRPARRPPHYAERQLTSLRRLFTLPNSLMAPLRLLAGACLLPTTAAAFLRDCAAKCWPHTSPTCVNQHTSLQLRDSKAFLPQGEPNSSVTEILRMPNYNAPFLPAAGAS